MSVTTDRPYGNIVCKRYLSSNGDGTGTLSATGDLSGTPLTLKLAADAGEICYIVSLTMTVTPGDSGNFANDGYCHSGSPLTNGIQLAVYRGTTFLFDLMGVNIKTNQDIFTIADGGLWLAQDFATHSVIKAELDFTTEQPIVLNGDNGDSIQAIFHDNMGASVTRFYAHGVKNRAYA